ncbi:hypothetical protein GCM10027598_61050 [Amycolatopsis oliviviridis]|uniref:Uncharacterized protein n=1 Tax=Amycolatopsis oliviviridis TaxID=1471590 RepID=A0ABQ3M2V6_9PSEU|nr:hypothetical protein GCM10017790_69350 [Amycolatopsis oliviviridis]
MPWPRVNHTFDAAPVAVPKPSLPPVVQAAPVPGAPGASAKGAALAGVDARSAAAVNSAIGARRRLGNFMTVLPTGFIDGRICC